MAGNSIQGSLTITTTAAQRSLRNAAKAMEEVVAEGKNITAAQRAAATAANTAAVKIVDAQRKVQESYAKTAREAIETQAKIRNAELKAQNDRKNDRAITGAKVEGIQTDTASRERLAILREETEEIRQQVMLRDQSNREDRMAGQMETERGRQILLQRRAQTEEVRQQIMLQESAARLQSQRLRDQLAIRREETRELQQQQRMQNMGGMGGALGHLNQMRYALYDVTGGLRTVGLALGAAALGVQGLAIAWERDFADVIRTTGVTGDAVGTLRGQFEQLVTTLPASWADLTKIGTLAGQLGIQEQLVGDFTKTVAMFAATTDVGVEQAATAFGRLNSLVPDVKGNFAKLGDSIAKVGVNSAATETQIIRISTQIASTASAAGFTSTQIVGLSGALASIAVPPELSRGVTTRVFGLINKSVSEGGLALEKWGQTIKMSGDEFRQAWNEDAAGTFGKFISSLTDKGAQAALILNDLGITSVRDVPILMRLATAANSAGEKGQLLAQAMSDAANSGGEMERQYGIISNTVGAKLQVLLQNIQLTLDKIGRANLGMLSDVIDNVRAAVEDFNTSLEDNFKLFGRFELPFTNAEAAGFALIVGGAVAALALLLAGLGRVAAGAIAMKTVINDVSASLIAMRAASAAAATALPANMTAMATTMTTSGRAVGGTIVDMDKKAQMATRSAGRFATAMAGVGKALGLTAILLAPVIIGQINDELAKVGTSAEDAAGAIQNFQESGGALKALGNFEGVLGGYKFLEDAEAFKKGLELLDADEFSMDIGVIDQKSDARNALKKLNEGYKTLISEGNGEAVIKQVGALARETDLTSDSIARLIYNTDLNQYFKSILRENGIKTTEANLVNLARNGLAFFGIEAKEGAEAAGVLDEGLEEAAAATQSVIDGLAATSAGFLDFNSAIETATEEGVLNIETFLQTVRDQVVAQQEWQTNMATIAASGVSSAFLNYLTELGPQAAGLIKEFAGNPAALAEAAELWRVGGGDAASKWAAEFQSKQSLADEVGRAYGDGARQEVLRAFAAGDADVPAIIARYQAALEANKMFPKLNMAEAEAAYQAFVDQRREVRINVLASIQVQNPEALHPGNVPYKSPESFNGGLIGQTHGIPGYARGGFVHGARASQKYQDTLLASLRPAEFVMREQAVNQYGKPLMDAMNKGTLDFANLSRPYPVSVNSPGGRNGTQLTELVASDKALLGAIVQAVRSLNFSIAPSDAAAAADRGNTSTFRKGGN